MCLLVPGHKAPPRSWLKDPDQIMIAESFVLDIPDDEDTSRTSWDVFSSQLAGLIASLQFLEQIPDSNILIVDDTGTSTAAAILAAYFIIRKQYRLCDIIEKCVDARPSIAMSLSLRRGLDQLQRTMDDKKMKRLDNKVRNSVVLSVRF